MARARTLDRHDLALAATIPSTKQLLGLHELSILIE
jgi:hypothetical protein